MARWKFILADSVDLRKNLVELHQARSCQLSVIFNRPGSLSFTFPMEIDDAALIQPISTAVKAYRFSSKHNQWKLKWSGPVWTIDEDISGGRMSVTCVGWQEKLAKRLLRREWSFSNTDDGSIIQALLGEIATTTWTNPPHDMNYTLPVPTGAYPNNPAMLAFGAKMPNEGVGGSTAYVNNSRTKTYQRYTSIGQAIQELTELENGCDIEITPEDRLLNVYRKRQRVTDVVFGYGWGPQNLQSFSRQHDVSSLVNHIVVAGRAGSTAGLASTAPPFPGALTGPSGTPDPDPDTRDNYGLFEEVVTLSDVVDSNVLLTYASAELMIRYRPRIIYSLTPFPFTPGSSVPEPFEDYTIGDRVFLTAVSLPRVSIQNQGIRIFGISVSIDEEGNERIGSLQTAPGG